MIKKLHRLSVALIGVVLLSVCFCITASAETAASEEHGLTLTLPDGYVLLNSDTAEDNKDIIESLGYTVSSFENYLKASGENSATTLFLGIEPQTKAQISVKNWSTDFSKKITDLSLLSGDALTKTAKELVKVEGASYKTVSVNGMALIEIRANGKDSGGDFCSVQYLTVRNGQFYSVTATFEGSIDDAKVDIAWKTVSSLEIENANSETVWDAETILIMILLGAVILAGAVAVVIILYSFIKDIKNRRSDAAESSDYIERRR